MCIKEKALFLPPFLTSLLSAMTLAGGHPGPHVQFVHKEKALFVPPFHTSSLHVPHSHSCMDNDVIGQSRFGAANGGKKTSFQSSSLLGEKIYVSKKRRGEEAPGNGKVTSTGTVIRCLGSRGRLRPRSFLEVPSVLDNGCGKARRVSLPLLVDGVPP